MNEWIKSTFFKDNDCVEIKFARSSFCHLGGCVEVALVSGPADTEPAEAKCAREGHLETTQNGEKKCARCWKPLFVSR